MSDNPINLDDLTSTKSITDKIASSFYPNDQVVIKNTSLSKQPFQDRTLRSLDPVKLLQGDGLYRNPAYAVNAYAQSTQSALHRDNSGSGRHRRQYKNSGSQRSKWKKCTNRCVC